MIDGELTPLHVLSTMGCGFTFSVMTLTLAALCYGVIRVYGKKQDQFSVFGDDIVLPTYLAGTLMELLGDVNFIVNNEKSFTSGDFRESCGGDYRAGKDVTPVYIRSFSTESDVYSIFNRLVLYGKKHSITFNRTAVFLLHCCRSVYGRVLFVPTWEQIDSGIHTELPSREYIYLRPTTYRKKLRCSPDKVNLAYMLFIGGYLTTIVRKRRKRGKVVEVKHSYVYTPRSFGSGYTDKHAVIPSGFTALGLSKDNFQTALWLETLMTGLPSTDSSITFDSVTESIE